MGLRQILNHWKKEDEWIEFSEITVVLHTSCVNYSDDDFQYLQKIGVRWCIPDNVRVELMLLCDSQGPYCESARKILTIAKRFGPVGRRVDGKRRWDLEQLYKGCRQKVSPDELCCGAMLFLFGDLAKQNEFLENAVSLPGHYVLVGTSWDCISGYGNRIRSLSAEQEVLRKGARVFWNGRKVCPIGNVANRNPLEELRRIRSVLADGVVNYRNLHGGQFHDTGNGGSYGEIFKMSAFEKKLLKVYKRDRALRGDDIGKLNYLALYAELLQHLSLAMPEELLHWSDEHDEDILIGYVMKELHGKPIRYYYHNGWEELNDSVAVLRSIARTLVELHCRHILVNDLSFHNILVDDDGEVGMVDCDSFQICAYPGGHITEIYRHPQIRMESCERCLRQPRYEYFAFAVLMYQCVMQADPLLCRGEDPDDQRSWENRVFPLEWDTTGSDRVNGAILARWREQDDAFRKAFADIFHFRADYSIGALVREMEIL